MTEKTKVLALVMPASGHINMMCCLIKELVTEKNFHVILHSVEKYKDLVQKSGAEYRQFKNASAIVDLNTNINIMDVMHDLLDLSKNVLAEMIECCNKEKPDLILSDALSNYGRYLVNHLEKKEKNNKLNYKLPKVVLVYPCFAFLEKIYPNKKEKSLAFGKFNFQLLKQYIKLSLKQRKINKQFDLTYPTDFLSLSRTMARESHLFICGVFHELQPRADNMIHRFKFIGCCISDEVRSFDLKNEKLKDILETFNPRNPISIEEANKYNGKILIYTSLGTVFNNNLSVFERIIHGFEKFDQEPVKSNSKIKLKDLELIISVGDVVFEKFQHKINNENFQLPNNVLILPSVPQIEILKRASLFITHAGMNSTSETIHYGVPVICLPIMGDQPLVALRICDELNFGIRLDYRKFDSDELRTSMHEILGNKKYLENILEFTELSRNRNGCQIGANLIVDYLNQ
jgi:UDP:flavonoid glycosyltransferase YjiC (YdhE family)